jgi:hypothetical protein
VRVLRIGIEHEELDIPELVERMADMRRRAREGPRLKDINGRCMRRTEEDIAAHRRHNERLADACELAIKEMREGVSKL